MAVLALCLALLTSSGLLGFPAPTRGAVLGAASLASWNPNVTCQANDVTLQYVLGNMFPYESLTGSPYQTGSSTGGVPSKRALSPPCTITNVYGQTLSSFVEVDKVYLEDWTFVSGDCSTKYSAVNGGGSYPGGATYCDNIGDVEAVGTSYPYNGFIHVEMDQDWFAKGYCGGQVAACNSTQLKQEISSGKISLDLQGFVYWDDAQTHWELHPFTGWKLSSSTPPPSASASASPASATVGQTITFTCSASGGTSPYTYAWAFGDGTTGSGSTATHAYGAAGTYAATCTVTDAASSTASASVTVTVTAALSASASASPSSAQVNQAITFTCTATGGTSPYGYAWAFGDGTTGTGSSVSHAYATAGTYTATCTVTDAAATTASASTTVTVTATAPPLSASVSASPNPAIVNQTITFTCTASGGTSPYAYAWTFGDGTLGTGSTATHAYTAPGTYTATCTVTDAAATTASGSVAITVTSPATLSSWNPNVTCTPANVTLAYILGSNYPYEDVAGSPYQTGSSTGGIPAKRALAPPCTITNVNGQTLSSFVQVDGVWLKDYTFVSGDCATSYDAVNGGGPYPNGASICDNVGDIEALGTSYPNNGFLYIEFDRDWLAKGYCGWQLSYCNNATMKQEISTGNISLDVQGFVYWNPTAQHWELHALTAWRLSTTPATAALRNALTPQPVSTAGTDVGSGPFAPGDGDGETAGPAFSDSPAPWAAPNDGAVNQSIQALQDSVVFVMYGQAALARAIVSWLANLPLLVTLVGVYEGMAAGIVRSVHARRRPRDASRARRRGEGPP